MPPTIHSFIQFANDLDANTCSPESFGMTETPLSIKSASIIITSYNYAQFVGQAIASALSQTFPNVEVIVVDDGSTDDSLTVIRSFGDRVTLILQENKGAPEAEYVGFLHAKGDLVIFLDSDDCLHPTAIEKSVAMFTKDTSKVQFYLEAINTEGLSLGFTLPPKMPCEKNIESLLFDFGFYPFPPTSGNVYARWFLQQILPCSEAGIGASTDLYATVLAPIYGRVGVCAEVLGRYRLHGRNMYGLGVTKSVHELRQTLLPIVASQRALQSHCARLNKRVRSNFYCASPYFAKLRLISLKAVPATHPFPEDRISELVRHGIAATLRRSASTGWHEITMIQRLGLILQFLALPFLPNKLVEGNVSILTGGWGRLSSLLKIMFRSASGRIS
jgi:glycosyltransferase involved in cell wall biosynthesis